MEEEIKVGGRLVKALRIADDQAILAYSQEGRRKNNDPSE